MPSKRDKRFTVWTSTHHMIRALVQAEGSAVAETVGKLGYDTGNRPVGFAARVIKRPVPQGSEVITALSRAGRRSQDWQGGLRQHRRRNTRE